MKSKAWCCFYGNAEENDNYVAMGAKQSKPKTEKTSFWSRLFGSTHKNNIEPLRLKSQTHREEIARKYNLGGNRY